MMDVSNVYMMELTINNEYGHTSIHRSYEGALAMLEKKIDDFGVRDIYELSESMKLILRPNSTVIAADYDELSYAISYMEVQS